MINKFAFALSLTTICANIHPAYGLPKSEVIDTDFKAGIKVKRSTKPERILESRKNRMANKLAKKMAKKNKILERLKSRTAQKVIKKVMQEERKLKRTLRKKERFEARLKRRNLKRLANNRWLVPPTKLEPVSTIGSQKTSNNTPVSHIVHPDIVVKKPSVMVKYSPKIESSKSTLVPQTFSSVMTLDPVRKSPKKEMLKHIQDNVHVENGLGSPLLESPLDTPEKMAMIDEPGIQDNLIKQTPILTLASASKVPLQSLNVIESLKKELEVKPQIGNEKNASLILEQAFSTMQKAKNDEGVIEEKENSSLAKIARTTEEFLGTQIESVKTPLISLENGIHQVLKMLQETKSVVAENIAAVVPEEPLPILENTPLLSVDEVAIEDQPHNVQAEAVLTEVIAENLNEETQSEVREDVTLENQILETQPELVQENLIEEDQPELDLVVEAVEAQNLAKGQLAVEFDRREGKIESTIRSLTNSLNTITEESFNGYYPHYFAKDYRIPLEAQKERVENLLRDSETLQEDFDYLELQLVMKDELDQENLRMAKRIKELKNDSNSVIEELGQLNSLIYSLPPVQNPVISNSTTPSEDIKPTIISTNQPSVSINSSQEIKGSSLDIEKKDNKESTLSDSSRNRKHIVKIMGKDINFDLKETAQDKGRESSQILSSMNNNNNNNNRTIFNSSTSPTYSLKISGVDISYPVKPKVQDKDKGFSQNLTSSVHTNIVLLDSIISPIKEEEKMESTILNSAISASNVFTELGNQVDLLLTMGERLNSAELTDCKESLIRTSAYLREELNGTGLTFISQGNGFEEELTLLKSSLENYRSSTQDPDAQDNVSYWLNSVKYWGGKILNKLGF